MSDIQVLMFMIIFLVIMNFLFLRYDATLCPSIEAQEYNFTTEFNASEERAYEDIRAMKCEGVPSWIYIIFNSPFLLGIGLTIKKYVLI